MQAIHVFQLGEQIVSQLDRVLDLCAGRQIQQDARNLFVMMTNVDATDQVSGILFVSQPARGSAGGTPIRQHIDGAAASSRTHERISMNRDKEV